MMKLAASVIQEEISGHRTQNNARRANQLRTRSLVCSVTFGEKTGAYNYEPQKGSTKTPRRSNNKHEQRLKRAVCLHMAKQPQYGAAMGIRLYGNKSKLLHVFHYQAR